MSNWFAWIIRRVLLICATAWLTMLIGCQSSSLIGRVNSDDALYIVGSSVAVGFGPDGRLWRLIPSEESVTVDYSDDLGRSFKQPVKVNQSAQKINAWPENPPVITVSESGRIHVLYYADAEQRATTFFSFSDDQGKTFSKPRLVSDHASTNMHYMDKMLVDKQNKLYLLWHDTRHEQHNSKLGAGALSLFYTVTQDPEQQAFISHKVSDGICSCCRTAADFTPEGLPVLLVRMVFNQGVRDHALITMQNQHDWSDARRITFDNWKIEACPEHGPALSIDNRGRSHFTWFTLGEKRQGIFYAYSDDYGAKVSEPMQLGNNGNLPKHPDVLALGDRVILAWKEFDGNRTSIIVKQSRDRGNTWQPDTSLLRSSEKSGHPVLVNNGEKVFLSWTDQAHGHRFAEIK